MLLTLIIVVALIGAAVIGTIYSNFLVFYSNFEEAESYNKAYYASVAALERGELATKQRQPGYKGEGGWNGENSIAWGGDGPIPERFSYLSRDSGIDTMSHRLVLSLTNRIPSAGQGNVDRSLSTGDSLNYNMMDYNDSETFLLYADPNRETNPYVKIGEEDMERVIIDGIKGKIRLPGYLRDTFGDLNTSSGMMNNVKNDAIVDWQVVGKFKNSPFTIFATQRTSPQGDILDEDTAIRESNLNDSVNLRFGGGNHQSPIKGQDKSWTINSQEANNIRSFENIFTVDGFSQVQIKFSLLNLMKNSRGDIYPFLEYFLDFGDKYVPDKYYTITAEGNYGDYQVKLTVQKPTTKESILQAFTTIF